ncbi:MAG TPA: cell division protein FtsA [Dehalococcoidia bacterium]|nr:cell division protein FtsA [Dehalococcoidia bacterium]
MRTGGTFAAIDLGSTKVCTIVGDLALGPRPRILGVGTAPSHGISRAMVDNIAEATESIRVSVEKAERASGTRIFSAYVSMSGSHIASLNNRGIVAIPQRDRPISVDDVERVIEASRTVSIPTNREIVHAVPRYYVVDGQDHVSDPIGMYGQRLDVETHVVTGALSAIQNVRKCVEGSGIQVDDLVLSPMAAALSVLDEEEREQGVVLADIGGGTTDIAIFSEGAVMHTSVLPVGGYHLTRDLVVGLRVPYHAAEQLKREHGNVMTSISEVGVVEVEAFGTERRREVPLRRIGEVLQARAEEMLEMIFMEARRAGYEETLSAGLVLTGGTAGLRGLPELAEQVLGIPARVGVPRHLQGLLEAVDDPALATATGLLEWAVFASAGEVRSPRATSSLDLSGLWRKLGSMARAVLPQ